ncbi:MAG: NAD-dependent epimerase/dehydratase family protein [Solirubrobacteraceae bacterium]
MRYLVTGGAGFIGSHLTDALIRRGDEVVILDDFSTGSRENIVHFVGENGVNVVEGSILDSDLVDELVRSVDVCMHLASAVGVQLVVAQPLATLQCNIRGNDIVISATARHERRLLFTSTSEVYGKQSPGALSEDCDSILGSPLKSRWSYAIAKSYGEALVSSHHRERDFRGTVVRLFNTVGPRQTGRYGMVVPRLVRQALAGEDLTVYGDGQQSRCFTHVADSVAGILDVCDSENSDGRVFNIGNPVEITIAELARRVIDRTGSRSRIVFVPYDVAYGDGFEELGRRKPDIAAIGELSGWTPQRSADEAIDQVIEFQRTMTTITA